MRRDWLRYLYVFLDFLVSYAWWIGFYFLRHYYYQTDSIYQWQEIFLKPAAAAVFWVVLYGLAGLYEDPLRKSRATELFTVGWTTALGSMALFFIVFLDDPIPSYRIYPEILVIFMIMQWAAVVTVRWLADTLIRREIYKQRICFPTLLVGNGPTALRIYQKLQKEAPLLGYDLKGYLYVEGKNFLQGQLKQLGELHDLEKALHTNQIEQVVIALEPVQEKKFLRPILWHLNGAPIQIHMAPDLRDILSGNARIRHVLGHPFVEITPHYLPPWQAFLKRLIDICVSLGVLVVFFPLYVIIALLVKASSPGPIFFVQERIGRSGKPFKLYKFRSMYVDKSDNTGIRLAQENDPRITPIGRWLRKYRLDELPQFWNVLKGEMSLVGYRPEIQYYVDKITQRAPEYKRLFRIRPGITSLGMVKYGYASTVDQMIERLEYDMAYLSNMSLLLDFKILFYTVVRVMQARGK